MHGVPFVVACRAVCTTYTHVLHGVMVLERCQALIAVRDVHAPLAPCVCGVSRAGIDGGPVAS